MMADRAGKIVEQLRRILTPEVTINVRTNEDTIEIAPASGPTGLRLEVRVRSTADLEVAFVVPSKTGSPFEQVFVGPPEEEDAVVEEVVGFVADLVAERMVLAWDARWFRGGRRFLRIDELTPDALRHLAWVISWGRSHDWNARGGAGCS